MTVNPTNATNATNKGGPRMKCYALYALDGSLQGVSKTLKGITHDPVVAWRGFRYVMPSQLKNLSYTQAVEFENVMYYNSERR